MTTTTELAARLLGDMELMQALESAKATLDACKITAGHIEMEIMRRMKDRGANSIPNADANGEKVFVCECEETYTYDQTAFAPLREIFNREDMDTCYLPEHTKAITVPGSWVTQQVKKVAKQHGDEALAIVAQARMLKSLSLKFHRAPRD